jgi:hypothetical protein
MDGPDQSAGRQRPDGLEMLYRADGRLELRSPTDGGGRWIATDEPVELRR